MQPPRRTQPTDPPHALASTREEELRGSASRPVLEGYALDRVIAESAFAVVYLGTDVALKLPVAVKEYLPQRLARRHSASLVLPLPGEAQRFERGLQAFIEEARTLARCEHPSLLRVVRLVQANGTAYRVMPHHAGQRLDEMRRRLGAPFDAGALRGLLEGLLDAVQAWQLVGGVHGRVTPDNILVLLDGRPLLMGPGAVEAALTPGRGGTGTGARGARPPDGWPMGPWVDVHAVARVGRFCITGEWPQEGTDAAAEPLRNAMRRLGLAGARLPLDATLVDAIAAATSPEPQLRPQSAAQLREWLAHGPPAFAAVDVPVDVPVDAPRAAIPAPAVNGAAARVAPAAAAFGRGIVAPPTPPMADTAPRPSDKHPPEDAHTPFALPPDEVVVARDVGLNGLHVLGRLEPEGAAATAREQADEPSESARPVPQLTPELASLAGRLAANRDAVPAEGEEPDSSFALPGERRADGGLARRSGLPTWIFPVVALAVLVGLGVVLLIDQQPVRVEGWVPSRDAAPRVEEQRSIATAPPAPSSLSPPAPSSLSPPAPSSLSPTPPVSLAPPSSTQMPATALPGAAPVPAPPAAALALEAAPPPAAPAASAAPPMASRPPPTESPQDVVPERHAAAATPTTRPRAPHAPPVTPAKAAKPAPVVASPREACGDRTQFSLYRCMKTQCTEGRWWAHPQCVRLRMTDEVD